VSATEASKQALRRHARQRSDNVRKRIDKALTDLRRSGATINIAAVAKRAGVTRKAVYAHEDLLTRIRTHTRLAPAPTASSPTGQATNTIIDALRRQLAAKEREITTLRGQLRQRDNTIAVLHGKLEQTQP